MDPTVCKKCFGAFFIYEFEKKSVEITRSCNNDEKVEVYDNEKIDLLQNYTLQFQDKRYLQK